MHCADPNCGVRGPHIHAGSERDTALVASLRERLQDFEKENALLRRDHFRRVADAQHLSGSPCRNARAGKGIVRSSANAQPIPYGYERRF